MGGTSMFPSLLTIDKDLNEQEKNIEGPFQVILTTLPWVKKGEDQGCTMPIKYLGYKIKYINPAPGHKHKRSLYEIKPGVWVPRGQVPEIKLYKKTRRSHPKGQLQSKKQWDNYYAKHKDTLLKKGRIRKNNNKDKYWIINNRWNNSEKGFIMNLYSSALKESKKGRHGKGIPVPFDFTKETWWQHWLKQKATYGMYCPYSKVLMTTMRGKGRGTRGGGKRNPTNISKDQIWPGRGYTPLNLIFCTVKFNNDKQSITPDGCEAVTDVHNQRMNNWAKQMIRKRNV